MSEENVEIARRLYPGPMDVAALIGDPKALEAFRAASEPLVHPDFETIADPRYQMLLGDPGQAAAGPSQLTGFTGVDGFVDAFREWLSEWEGWVATPTEFRDVDRTRVLVMLEISGRSKAQQFEMTVQGGNVTTFREGRLARLELFFRGADALEAAGLSE